MFGKLLLYFALLLWFVVPAKAQPAIILPQLTAETQEQIAVEVQVLNFENIVSTQFSVKWDPLVIQYDFADNLNLPMLDTALHFGTTNAHNGVAVFAWLDETLVGVNRADNSSIFTLHFTVIGQQDAQSALWFDEIPAVIEIADTSGIVDDFNLQDGSVTVDNPVAVSKIPATLTSYQNFPNPFSESTTITFDLRTAQEVTLTICDIKGVPVLQHVQRYGAGHHTIDIHKGQLPQAGMYQCKLEAFGQVVNEKLVLVQ